LAVRVRRFVASIGPHGASPGFRGRSLESREGSSRSLGQSVGAAASPIRRLAARLGPRMGTTSAAVGRTTRVAPAINPELPGALFAAADELPTPALVPIPTPSAGPVHLSFDLVSFNRAASVFRDFRDPGYCSDGLVKSGLFFPFLSSSSSSSSSCSSFLSLRPASFVAYSCVKATAAEMFNEVTLTIVSRVADTSA
jgi:hypothetical protein